MSEGKHPRGIHRKELSGKITQEPGNGLDDDIAQTLAQYINDWLKTYQQRLIKTIVSSGYGKTPLAIAGE